MNFGEHAMAELEKGAAKVGRKLNRAEAVALLTVLFEAACPAKRRLVNGRNLLFDAFVEVCGLEANVPPSQGALIGKCCAEVTKVLGDVPLEDMVGEIKRRGAAYARKYPGVTITPRAIMMHWAEFPAARRAVVAGGPKGWLAKLNELYPDSTMAKGAVFEITQETDYQWGRLEKSLQEILRKALP